MCVQNFLAFCQGCAKNVRVFQNISKIVGINKDSVVSDDLNADVFAIMTGVLHARASRGNPNLRKLRDKRINQPWSRLQEGVLLV